RRDRRAVELVDGGLVIRVEGEVIGSAHLAFGDPEVVASTLDEPERVAVFLVDLVTEGRQRPFVEIAARAGVAAAHADVLDDCGTGPEFEVVHGSIPFGSDATSWRVRGRDPYVAFSAGKAKESQSAA